MVAVFVCVWGGGGEGEGGAGSRYRSIGTYILVEWSGVERWRSNMHKNWPYLSHVLPDFRNELYHQGSTEQKLTF